MKLLKCKLCSGEMEIIGNENAVHKKVKCLNPKCGFTNETKQKEPEIIIYRKRT